MEFLVINIYHNKHFTHLHQIGKNRIDVSLHVVGVLD